MKVLLEEIAETVCLQFGVEQARAEDHFIEDLSADSADVLNLVVAIEDRYDIAIGEEHVAGLRTVDDLYRLTVELVAGR